MLELGHCGLLIVCWNLDISVVINGAVLAGVEPCTDSDGDRIMDGKDFTPDYNDACKVCTCDGGLPILCRTAVCSPPSGCQQIEPVPRQCCQFVCKDDGKTFLVPPANSNLTNQLPGMICRKYRGTVRSLLTPVRNKMK